MGECGSVSKMDPHSPESYVNLQNVKRRVCKKIFRDDDDHEDRVATYESVLFEEEVSVGVRAGVIGAANTNATVLPQVGFVADQEELAKLMQNTDRRGFLKETNVVRSQNDDEVEDEDENGKASQAY